MTHHPARTPETADDYPMTTATLSDRYRVIVCKDGLQWILQKRTGGSAVRPWRSLGYFLTRGGLMRSCAALYRRGDIAEASLQQLSKLPVRFSGASLALA